MLSAAISSWEAVPTELDELWCPSMEFASGGAEGTVTLLVEGGSQPSRPTFDGERHYLLRFSRVVAVSGYAESLYCIFVRPADPAEPRIGTRIQRACQSDLVDRARELSASDLSLFGVFSGDMQCEVVADPHFALERYPTREHALEIVRSECRRKTANYEAGQPDADAFLNSLIHSRGAAHE